MLKPWVWRSGRVAKKSLRFRTSRIFWSKEAGWSSLGADCGVAFHSRSVYFPGLRLFGERALDYTVTRVPRKSFADLRSPSLLEKKLAPSQLCLWASSATAPATVNLPVPVKLSSTYIWGWSSARLVIQEYVGTEKPQQTISLHHMLNHGYVLLMYALHSDK